MSVEESSDVLLGTNSIIQNKVAGIVVRGESNASCDGNDIRANENSGIVVQGNARAILDANLTRFVVQS